MSERELEAMSRDELVTELRRVRSGTPRWHEITRRESSELASVIHDLQVHQIELEMQNRELRETHALLEESRSRYADLYDFAPVGYCSIDLDGVIAELNLTAATLLGARRDGLIGRSLVSVVAPGDRKAVDDHLRECVRTQSEVTTELMFSLHGRGAAVVRMVSAPIHDASRNVLVGFRTALIDESASKQLEGRLRFLGDAGEQLASCADYPEALRTVVQIPVPAFAAQCLIHIVDDLGQLARVGAAFADPALAELTSELDRPQGGESWQTAQEVVVASGQPMLRPTAGASTCAAIVVPLVARGRALGTLTFGAGPDRSYSTVDLRFAEDLARRAALAIDNTRLLERARQETTARDRLLSIVSHDLGGPLGVVIMATELLLASPAEAERRSGRRHIEAIRRSAVSMRRLVGDLLDAASIEAGRISVNLIACPADSLVEEAVDLFRPQAEARGLTLTHDATSGGHVPCDRERIRQVFSNLIGNAIKFTPAGGSIRVGVSAERRLARFWVQDTGMGIAGDQLGHVFDRFWQTESARVGHGLGLSIAKAIVELHGGAMTVESEVGVGTTFVFTLPLQPRGRGRLARGTSSAGG